MIDWGFDVGDFGQNTEIATYQGFADLDNNFVNDRMQSSIDLDNNLVNDRMQSSIDLDNNLVNDRMQSFIDLDNDFVSDGAANYPIDLTPHVQAFGFPSPF
jgi:hypothetical protein